MRKLLLLAALAATTLAAHADNWTVYDQNGNYYWGNYDSQTNKGHLYDQNGGYYWTNDGHSMYDNQGHYWYRSGNYWYRGN